MLNLHYIVLIKQKDNVDNLLRIFKERNLANSYQMELNYVQYTVLRLLQPTLRDPRCYSLWKETYRGIWKRFLLNPNVNMKDKLKFVFIIHKTISLCLSY